MEQSKNVFKRILIGLAVLIVSSALGYLLMVLVYYIPVDSMKENVAESCELFKKEGTYYKVSWNANSRLDNYTDASMLLTAAYDVDNAWRDSLYNSVTYVTDLMPDESLVAIYGEGVKDYTVIPYLRKRLIQSTLVA